jgi:hypothetical protein
MYKAWSTRQTTSSARLTDVRKWVDGADVFSDRSQPHGVGLQLIKVNGS